MKNTLEQKDARLKSRRTIFTGPDEDRALLACALAELGRSAAYVQRVTGLTPGQAYYRAKFLGMTGTRAMWRDGSSTTAREIEDAMLERVEARVYGRLESAREPEQSDRFTRVPHVKKMAVRGGGTVKSKDATRKKTTH